MDFQAGQTGDFQAGPARDFQAGNASDFQAGPARDFQAGQARDFQAGQTRDFQVAHMGYGNFDGGQDRDFQAVQTHNFQRGQDRDFQAVQTHNFPRGQDRALQDVQAGDFQRGQGRAFPDVQTGDFQRGQGRAFPDVKTGDFQRGQGRAFPDVQTGDFQRGQDRDFQAVQTHNFQRGQDRAFQDVQAGDFQRGQGRAFPDVQTGDFQRGQGRAFPDVQAGDIQRGQDRDFQDVQAGEIQRGQDRDFQDVQAGDIQRGQDRAFPDVQTGDFQRGQDRDYQDGQAGDFQRGQDSDYQDVQAGDFQRGQDRDFQDVQAGDFQRGQDRDFQNVQAGNFQRGQGRAFPDVQTGDFQRGQDRDFQDVQAGNFQRGQDRAFQDVQTGDFQEGQDRDFQAGQMDNFQTGQARHGQPTQMGNFQRGQAKDRQPTQMGDFQTGQAKDRQPTQMGNFQRGQAKDRQPTQMGNFQTGQAREGQPTQMGNFQTGQAIDGQLTQTGNFQRGQARHFQTGQTRDIQAVQTGTIQAGQTRTFQSNQYGDFQTTLPSSSNYAENIHQRSSLPRSLSPRSVILEENQNRDAQSYDSSMFAEECAPERCEQMSLMEVQRDQATTFPELNAPKETRAEPKGRKLLSNSGQFTNEDLARPISEMIILELSEWANSPFNILKNSAANSGLLVEWSCDTFKLSRLYKCTMYIQKIFQATAMEMTKKRACDCAAFSILCKLYKTQTILQTIGQDGASLFTWEGICEGARDWFPPDDNPDLPDVYQLSIECDDTKGHQPVTYPKEALYACVMLKKHIEDKVDYLKDIKLDRNVPLPEQRVILKYVGNLGFRCKEKGSETLFSPKLSVAEIVDIVKESPTRSVGKYRLLRLGNEFVSSSFKSVLGIPLVDDPTADKKPMVWKPETVKSKNTASSKSSGKFVAEVHTNKDKLEEIHGPQVCDCLEKPLSSFVMFLREESSPIPRTRSFFIIHSSASRGGYLLEWKLVPVYDTFRCEVYLQKRFFMYDKAGTKEDAKTAAFHASYRKLKKTSTFVLIRSYATKLVNLWPWDHISFKASKWNPSHDEVVNLDSFVDETLMYPNVLQYALCILRESIMDPVSRFEECIFQNVPENEAKCLTAYATSVLRCKSRETGDPGKHLLHFQLKLSVEEIMTALSENDGAVGRYKIIVNPDNPPEIAPKLPDHSFSKTGKWTCGKCCSLNFAKRSTCKSCGKKRDKDDEKAFRALTANPHFVSCSTKLRPGFWTCEQCNHVNYAGKVMCDECCTPRDNSDPDVVILKVEPATVKPVQAKPDKTQPVQSHPATQPGKPDKSQPDTQPGKPDKSQPDTQPGKPDKSQPDTPPGKPDKSQPDTQPGKPGKSQPDTQPGKPDKSQPDTQPWECGSCQFVNFASRPSCKKCNKQRSSSDLPVSVKPKPAETEGDAVDGVHKDWTCGQCDYINLKKHSSCNSCGEKRYLDDEDDNDSLGEKEDGRSFDSDSIKQDSNWKCGSCKFVNFFTRLFCTECGKQRSSSDLSIVEKPIPAETDDCKDAGDWNCGSCRFVNFATRPFCKICRKQRYSSVLPVSVKPKPVKTEAAVRPVQVKPDRGQPDRGQPDKHQADTEPWPCVCGNVNAANCLQCLKCKELKRRRQEPLRDAGRGRNEMSRVDTIRKRATAAGREINDMSHNDRIQDRAKVARREMNIPCNNGSQAGRGINNTSRDGRMPVWAKPAGHVIDNTSINDRLQEWARPAGHEIDDTCMPINNRLQEWARPAGHEIDDTCTSINDRLQELARPAGRGKNIMPRDNRVQEPTKPTLKGTNLPQAGQLARINQGSGETQVGRAGVSGMLKNVSGYRGTVKEMGIPPTNKPPSLMEGFAPASKVKLVPPGYWTCGQCGRLSKKGKIMCDKCCAPRVNPDLVIVEVEAGRQYSDSNRSLLLKFYPNGEDMSRPISALIILEQMEWSRSAFIALDESAARAGLLVEWEYKEVINMVSCKLYIQKRLVSSSSKSSRNQAQDEAALTALADLYKTNKVIQLRPQEDSNIWYTWQSIQRGARNSPIPSINDLISVAEFVSDSVDVDGVSALLNQPIKSSKESLFVCHTLLTQFTDFSGRLQDCVFDPSLPEHVRKFVMNFASKLNLNCRMGSIHDEPDTTYPCFSINVSFSEIVSVLEQRTTEVGKYRLLKMGTKQFASLLGVPGFDTVKQIDPSINNPSTSQTPAFDSRGFKHVADDNMRSIMNEGQRIYDFAGGNKDNSGLRNDGSNPTETSNQTRVTKKKTKFEKRKEIQFMKGSWSNREQIRNDVNKSRSVLNLIVVEPEDLSENRNYHAHHILTSSCTRSDILIEWSFDPTDLGHRCQVYIEGEVYGDQLSEKWQDARRLAFSEAILRVYRTCPVIVKMKAKHEEATWTWEKLETFAEQWNPDVDDVVQVPSRTEHGIIKNAQAVSFACYSLKSQMNDSAFTFDNMCTFAQMPEADRQYLMAYADKLGYMTKIRKQGGKLSLIATRRICLETLVDELLNNPSGCLGRYRMLKQSEIDDYFSKQQYEASNDQGSGDMEWESM